MAEIVAALAQSGRLSQRQMRAAHALLEDLQADAGTSGNIAALYGERVQTSLRRNGCYPQGWRAVGDRVQSILDCLPPYQRTILDFLVRNREIERRSLADFGRSRASYADANAATGYAVGQVAVLLETIADLYLRYDPAQRV